MSYTGSSTAIHIDNLHSLNVKRKQFDDFQTLALEFGVCSVTIFLKSPEDADALVAAIASAVVDDGWDNVPEPPAQDDDEILADAMVKRTPSPLLAQIHADFYGHTLQEYKLDEEIISNRSDEDDE